jgi:hypothetical protein
VLIPRRLRTSVEERRAKLLGQPVPTERRATSPDPVDGDRRYALDLQEQPD